MNSDSTPDIAAPAQQETSVEGNNAVQTPVYEGVNLVLKCVTDRCWLEVTSDGKVVFSGIMEAGQTQTYEAKDNISIHYGNIGAMEITVNGKTLPKDPEEGSVVRTYNK